MVKYKEIRLIDSQVDQIQKDKLSIGGCNSYPEANREYYRQKKHSYSRYNLPHSGGAATCTWTAIDVETSVKYEVEATDVYGSSWEISRCKTGAKRPETDGENIDNQKGGLQASKQVLYRWNSRAFTSLVPPIIGWSAVNGGLGDSDKDMTVTFIANRGW